MKILFIAGSLEMGKDGVGDYTRRLACELIKRNHEVEILAINDRYVSTEWNGMQTDSDIDVYVKRLPSNSSWKARLFKAQEYVGHFAPQWISLQFVIFTFHPKGMPLSLYSRIKQLTGARVKWHIMFHELWIGMNDQATLKFKLSGLIQKNILYSFLKKLKPSVIHTHASVYRYQLNKMGFAAKSLPLFTNVVVDKSVSKDLEERGENRRSITFSLFGGIHPDAPVEQFADELNEYQKEKGTHVEVKIVGKSGSEQKRWFDALRKENVSTVVTGELSSEDVTKELLSSEYGVSTTPALLSGKSSAIATMLGHDLPVICVTKAWTIKKIQMPAEPEAIFNYEPGSLSRILNVKVIDVNVPTLQSIADRFTQDLSEAGS